MKAELHQLDSQLPLPPPTTLEQSLEHSVADRRFQRVLLLAFALTALALASLGIYGLMAYSGAQRRRELGIRLALGAMPRDVVRLVMRHALWMCAVGVGVGLVLALALSRVVVALAARTGEMSTGRAEHPCRPCPCSPPVTKWPPWRRDPR